MQQATKQWARCDRIYLQRFGRAFCSPRGGNAMSQQPDFGFHCPKAWFLDFCPWVCSHKLWSWVRSHDLNSMRFSADHLLIQRLSFSWPRCAVAGSTQQLSNGLVHAWLSLKEPKGIQWVPWTLDDVGTWPVNIAIDVEPPPWKKMVFLGNDGFSTSTWLHVRLPRVNDPLGRLEHHLHRWSL